ncbi:MAG TPA: SDR family oxidoreductase [Burkholderiales bacterium]|jgi:nucleoside-diphosphate-sugar epimerase|nr:SDR family oxidoreductase [Burkholderiales bacterium]
MKTALVAGATGVVGRYLLAHLVAKPDWSVIAVSRRSPEVAGNYRHVAVDLADAAQCKARLGELRAVSHVFYAAYVERPTTQESSENNVALLRNLLDAIEPAATQLQHVHLVQGTKWYGSHLGPFKTPAKETDPRLASEVFYYAQQDLLEVRQRGRDWTWSAVRPHAVCGFALGNSMNLTMVLAVYASICKELGMVFSHPGKPANWRTLYQVTDSGLLARAIEWMATSPQCANQAYNITNGDLFRWEYVWPKLAALFGLEAGPPRPFSLQDFMQDKAPVWERIVAKHGLEPNRFEDVAAWKFGDFVFSAEWDVISDCGKARRAGFCETVDSEEMFSRLFAGFRANRIIP